MRAPGASPARIVEVSPNAILAMLAMSGLAFVPWIGAPGVMAFLAAGMLLYLRQPALIVPETLRYWWILTVPAVCLLTVFWSDYPAQTVRFSLQLGVTFAIAVAIGNRVSPDDFFRLLCLPFGLAMVASLLAGNSRSDGVWLGIFVSKNAFAAAASTFTLLAAALVFAAGQRTSVRIAALVAAALGAFLMLKAQSTGTLALTALACAMAPFFTLMRRMSPRGRGAVLVFTLLGLLLAAVVLLLFRDALMAYALQTTGKDPTLTGRTDLWHRAFSLIAARPFGVGYGAFWVPGNPEAEYIWDMFNIQARPGFNFHNTYISNAVEVGPLGVIPQVAVLGAALALSVRRAFAGASAAAIFGAIFMIELVAQSLIEVVAFSQFSPRSVIVIVLAVHGFVAPAFRH